MENYKAYDVRLSEGFIALNDFKNIKVKAIAEEEISKCDDKDFNGIFNLVKAAKPIGEVSLIEVDEDSPFFDWYTKSTKWKASIDETQIKEFGYGNIPLEFQGALYGKDENGDMIMAIFPKSYENTYAGRGSCQIKFELLASEKLLKEFDIKK